MTREQKIAKAKELREEGLTYREIGERISESNSVAWGFCNPDARRAINKRDNAKRRAARRQWEEGECPGCGGRLANAYRSERCRECQREAQRRETRERVEHFIELREAGHTNAEIERMECLPYNAVANALCSHARRFGLAVPPSPYRSGAAA